VVVMGAVVVVVVVVVAVVLVLAMVAVDTVMQSSANKKHPPCTNRKYRPRLSSLARGLRPIKHSLSDRCRGPLGFEWRTSFFIHSVIHKLHE
jgi:hypothetical protein